MSERLSGWVREFDEPITLPDGRKIVYLRDAATFMLGLSPKERRLAEWQAPEALLLVVETRRSDDVRPDRHHASIEPPSRSRVYLLSKTPPLGAEEAQEGPMKPYLLVALACLIACAVAAVIFINTALLVSPD